MDLSDHNPIVNWGTSIQKMFVLLYNLEESYRHLDSYLPVFKHVSPKGILYKTTMPLSPQDSYYRWLNNSNSVDKTVILFPIFSLYFLKQNLEFNQVSLITFGCHISFSLIQKSLLSFIGRVASLAWLMILKSCCLVKMSHILKLTDWYSIISFKFCHKCSIGDVQ